ncbi:Uncharacterised protein [Candidatus Tiddalikarchaeum anstoanum]|nr:Uncharacterised protein [Candidatus Tiddalikarchaeum anstoanum]
MDFVDEPCLNKVLKVEQRGFGYLTPDSKKDYLETVGLFVCLGVYCEKRGEFQVLCHFDTDPVKQFNIMMKYLYKNDFSNTDFDRVEIIGGRNAFVPNIEKLSFSMETRGYYAEVKVFDLRSVSILYDKMGGYKFLNPKREIINSSILLMKGIKCENTGFEIF